MKARVTRFPIRADGSLGVREKCGPDLGKEFARRRHRFRRGRELRVVCPGANALGVITPAGAWENAVRDPAGGVLNLPSNMCFGGPDRRTASVGNLAGPSLPTLRVPHAGMALVHQL